MDAGERGCCCRLRGTNADVKIDQTAGEQRNEKGDTSGNLESIAKVKDSPV